MPRTLFGKLLVVVLAFCAMMTGVCILLMRAWHEEYHAEVDQIANRDTAKLIAESNLLFDDGPVDVNNYHRAVAELARINPAWEAYLLDDVGRIMASSASTENPVRSVVDVRPVEAFLGNAASPPIYGDDPQTETGREVFSAAEIRIPGCPAKFLYLVLRRTYLATDLQAVRQSQAINETAGVLVITAFLGVGASAIVMRVLTRNLGRLEGAMQEFRAAGFAAMPAKHRLGEEKANDEIDRLTNMFWELAERLQSQMRDLQRSDEMRREILANVSHDLRTPLAALSAHLETLALKPELDGQERDEYLTISIRQCHALSTLVEQLLEAARLDAGEVAIEPEPFHVGELLHDVAQKFKIRAEQSDVQLQIDSPSGLPLACGDIRLIERVLDNLLDNALRHTGAAGQIILSAQLENGRLEIGVTDTGEGLAAEEHDRVLERFYRSDASRASGAGHAGLGLAIVNGIVELHGGQFRLESEPGVGTQCTFDLPVA